MSDLEIRPIHKVLQVATSSIKYAKKQMHKLKHYMYITIRHKKIKVFLGILEFCKTNASYTRKSIQKEIIS